MSDRTTSGPGDERPTGRIPQPPDEDWTPEDAHVPRDPLPEERLPDDRTPEDAPPHPPGPAGMNTARGRSAEEPGPGPGREGLTADDRTPEDAPTHRPEPAHPPGPADTEGLRPGTEDLASANTTAEPPPRPGREPVPSEGRMAGESSMPDDGLGVPSPGDVTGREAHTTESRAPDTWPTAPGRAGTVGEAGPAPSGTGAPLLSHDETDRWERRIREVAAGFVDRPHGAVEEADRVVEEIATRFGEAVARRRRTLRRSWEASEDRGPGSETDTEQLRLALKDYRELAGRLLHL
ncbi:hypothetical protein ACWC0C_13165 [Streptomyces sp. NPDC001709]